MKKGTELFGIYSMDKGGKNLLGKGAFDVFNFVFLTQPDMENRDFIFSFVYWF